ncbi:MAG: hypothetical protein ACHQE6_10670, partial [Solirubrobacterales bacterium]
SGEVGERSSGNPKLADYFDKIANLDLVYEEYGRLLDARLSTRPKSEAPPCIEIVAKRVAETGTDQGDTRSARIPESASAEGACHPASVGPLFLGLSRRSRL